MYMNMFIISHCKSHISLHYIIIEHMWLSDLSHRITVRLSVGKAIDLRKVILKACNNLTTVYCMGFRLCVTFGDFCARYALHEKSITITSLYTIHYTYRHSHTHLPHYIRSYVHTYYTHYTNTRNITLPIFNFMFCNAKVA